MRLAVLANTPSEDEHPAEIVRFASVAESLGLGCAVVRSGEVRLFVGKTGLDVEGGGADRLLGASVVVPKLSLRTVTRDELAVLDVLESRGVPLLNSARPFEAARNKLTALGILASAGVPVPPTVAVRRLEGLEETLLRHVGGGPYVVKPAMGSKGRSVEKAGGWREVRDVVLGIWRGNRHEIVLVQPFITTVDGGAWDLRAFVVGGKILGTVRRDAPPGEFRANYSQGARVSLVDVSPEVRRLSMEAARALKLGMAGVDVLVSKGGPIVLEVNANPGWEGVSRAFHEAGRSFDRELARACAGTVRRSAPRCRLKPPVEDAERADEVEEVAVVHTAAAALKVPG